MTRTNELTGASEDGEFTAPDTFSILSEFFRIFAVSDTI